MNKEKMREHMDPHRLSHFKHTLLSAGLPGKVAASAALYRSAVCMKPWLTYASNASGTQVLNTGCASEKGNRSHVHISQ